MTEFEKETQERISLIAANDVLIKNGVLKMIFIYLKWFVIYMALILKMKMLKCDLK